MNIAITVPLLLLAGGGVGFSTQVARHWVRGDSWFERKKHGMQMDTKNGEKLVVNETNVVLMGNGWEGFATELERVLKSNGDVQEITVIGKIGEGQETLCRLGQGEQQVRATGLWDKDIVWTGNINQKGVSCFKQGSNSNSLSK
ncbi:hypothetical protein [Mycoplasma suis]|uniref:Uncharacterized protein n=2 Tax=Mycoplasma suis TaxID=57372 RepID=F0QRX0_MYCSL|nr:hypothetical protein [Mycoplasma suis]ADX98240.1 hypothetical protein MSU_0709 [Mycoplasma suis str. Illinois]CBZ40757.1 hypothetical protein MSUIS_06640 [Mycoplasma suis KI3806]